MATIADLSGGKLLWPNSVRLMTHSFKIEKQAHLSAKMQKVKKLREPKIFHGLEVTALSSDGRGIAKHDGKVVFVEMAAPGDVVDVEVRRDKKKYLEGKIAGVVSSSALRVKPNCVHFGICGGCKLQHIAFEEQLKFKRQMVVDAFERIGHLRFPEVPAVKDSEKQYYYRNKMEYTFTDRRWLTDEEIKTGASYEHRNGVGFHVPENFLGVIDVEHCWLQADPSNPIRLAARDFALQQGYTFFNLAKKEGFVRNLMVRTASTGETLVLFSFGENDQDKVNAMLSHLLQLFPNITSLQYVINTKKNDTIYDLETIVFHGKDHIIEQLGNYRFKIGPKSFFQTNSAQAKVLYDITKEFADLKPTDVVYDLYTGVGSIALYLSDACARITGIEQVEAAIVDAKENAQLNNVNNCTFYAGDVRMVLNPEFIATNGKPDVVVTDPPRAGMHEDVVNTLLELAAPRIVYVSCNPATQARDLQLLAVKYDILKVQPVGMFPQTTHIENVALLELRSK